MLDEEHGFALSGSACRNMVMHHGYIGCTIILMLQRISYPVRILEVGWLIVLYLV